MKQNKRDVTIDIAKGILIILMVWGHMICPFGTIIYNFHMAGFVIISGFYFSAKKSFKDYLINKAHRLLIPYLIFILYGIITDIIRRLIEGVPLMDKIIIYAEFWNCDSINSPLWFLPALFWVSVIYYLINKICNSKFQILIINIFIAVMGDIINHYHFELPLYFSQAILLVNFYSIGCLAKKIFETRNKYFTFIMVFIFLITSIYSQCSTSWIPIHINNIDIGNYLLYVFCGVVGTFNILKLTQFLHKQKICIKLLSYEGLNSLYILGFHCIIAFLFMKLYMNFSDTINIGNRLILNGLLFTVNLLALISVLFVTDIMIRVYKLLVK